VWKCGIIQNRAQAVIILPGVYVNRIGKLVIK